jgi:hypothetical protein
MKLTITKSVIAPHFIRTSSSALPKLESLYQKVLRKQTPPKVRWHVLGVFFFWTIILLLGMVTQKWLSSGSLVEAGFGCILLSSFLSLIVFVWNKNKIFAGFLLMMPGILVYTVATIFMESYYGWKNFDQGMAFLAFSTLAGAMGVGHILSTVGRKKVAFQKKEMDYVFSLLRPLAGELGPDVPIEVSFNPHCRDIGAELLPKFKQRALYNYTCYNDKNAEINFTLSKNFKARVEVRTISLDKRKNRKNKYKGTKFLSFLTLDLKNELEVPFTIVNEENLKGRLISLIKSQVSAPDKFKVKSSETKLSVLIQYKFSTTDKYSTLEEFHPELYLTPKEVWGILGEMMKQVY